MLFIDKIDISTDLWSKIAGNISKAENIDENEMVGQRRRLLNYLKDKDIKKSERLRTKEKYMRENLFGDMSESVKF